MHTCYRPSFTATADPPEDAASVGKATSTINNRPFHPISFASFALDIYL